jgi:hypothetical protein
MRVPAVAAPRAVPRAAVNRHFGALMALSRVRRGAEGVGSRVRKVPITAVTVPVIAVKVPITAVPVPIIAVTVPIIAVKYQ